MLQILINIFWPIKMKTKSFGISSMIIMPWLNCCKLFYVILLCWYKWHSICLTSFFNLYKLFPAFICANNIGTLLSNLFGVNIFNIFPFFTSSSSHSSGGMSGISINSSESSACCLLNFTLSVIVSSGCDSLFCHLVSSIQ